MEDKKQEVKPPVEQRKYVKDSGDERSLPMHSHVIVGGADSVQTPMTLGWKPTSASGVVSPVAPYSASVVSETAYGQSSAAGTVPSVSHGDHTHGSPSLSTATPQAVGTAAAGSGTTPSKNDHIHATGAGTPTTIAYGDAATTGTGPAASMTDHRHGAPVNPLIVEDATKAGNVGTSALEQTLFTYSFDPTVYLNTPGDSIKMAVNWTRSNNPRSTTIRVYYGATVICSQINAVANIFGMMEIVLTRITSGQRAAGHSAISSSTQTISVTAPAESNSSPVTIKVTGQVTTGTPASNDIAYESITISKF